MTAISRRSVARGALWSVPAVVVGAAAPVFAASIGITAQVVSVCKNNPQGTQQYIFTLALSNSSSQAVTFLITGVTFTSSTVVSPFWSPNPATWTLAPNTTQNVNLTVFTNNQAQGSGTISYTATLANGTVIATNVPVSVTGLPGC